MGMALSFLFIFICATAQAASLNIDFGSAQPAPPSSFGAAASQPGYWNQITTAGITSNLLDLTGAATSVALDLELVLDIHITGSGGCGIDANLCDLRGSNFYTNFAGWSLQLTNLDNGTYDLYYYSPTNGIVPTGNFSANGVPAGSITTSGADSLVQGSDWDKITVDVSSGTLDIGADTPAGNVGLAGIQLVYTAPLAIPEPSTIVLVGTFVAAIGLKRRFA
jgi:hypothetical protein